VYAQPTLSSSTEHEDALGGGDAGDRRYPPLDLCGEACDESATTIRKYRLVADTASVGDEHPTIEETYLPFMADPMSSQVSDGVDAVKKVDYEELPVPEGAGPLVRALYLGKDLGLSMVFQHGDVQACDGKTVRTRGQIKILRAHGGISAESAAPICPTVLLYV
jgi:hypothetical protein